MAESITSRRNPRIRHLRELLRAPRARREAGQFAAEGARAVCEALRAGWQPLELLLRDPPRVPRDIEALRALLPHPQPPAYLVAAQVLDWAIDAEGSVDAVAIFPLPGLPPVQAIVGNPAALLVGEDIQDPGNVGALLRIAEGAGLDGVLLLGQCADPFGPKAVRGSAGAVFCVNIARGQSFADVPWPELNLTLIGTTADAPTSCFSLNLNRSVALLFGNESRGLRPETLAACHELAAVPMAGQLPSLNVAAAAAVFAFECARQQGRLPG